MADFTGKVAVVTGGASGMGKAVVRQFCALGAKVVFGDISEDSGRALADEMAASGREAIFVKTDVSKADDVKRMVATAIERFGRLDIAANMAGVPQAGGMFCSESARDLAIGVNLMGTFLCVTEEVLAIRKTSKRGAIVNASSVAGVQGAGDAPYYVAAKHGIIGFTKSAALEVAAEGIRVNVILPGFTRSTMVENVYGSQLDVLSQYMPIGRLGTPDEQANAVVWLCSDESSFVTGACFSIDGGQTAGVPNTLVGDQEYIEGQ
jgi:NAD(P)-dependent dehydrogenase (short-subunit alcohol dehydrogenase family)